MKIINNFTHILVMLVSLIGQSYYAMDSNETNQEPNTSTVQSITSITPVAFRTITPPPIPSPASGSRIAPISIYPTKKLSSSRSSSSLTAPELPRLQELALDEFIKNFATVGTVNERLNNLEKLMTYPTTTLNIILNAMEQQYLGLTRKYDRGPLSPVEGVIHSIKRYNNRSSITTTEIISTSSQQQQEPKVLGTCLELNHQSGAFVPSKSFRVTNKRNLPNNHVYSKKISTLNGDIIFGSNDNNGITIFSKEPNETKFIPMYVGTVNPEHMPRSNRSQTIATITISDNQKVIATGSQEGIITIWHYDKDNNTIEHMQTIDDTPTGDTQYSETIPVTCSIRSLMLDHKGMTILALFDRRAHVWTRRKKTEIFVASSFQKSDKPDSPYIFDNPASTNTTISTDTNITDDQAGNITSSLHPDTNHCAISGDGSTILTTHNNPEPSFFLWHLHKKKSNFVYMQGEKELLFNTTGQTAQNVGPLTLNYDGTEILASTIDSKNSTIIPFKSPPTTPVPKTFLYPPKSNNSEIDANPQLIEQKLITLQDTEEKQLIKARFTELLQKIK